MLNSDFEWISFNWTKTWKCHMFCVWSCISNDSFFVLIPSPGGFFFWYYVKCAFDKSNKRFYCIMFVLLIFIAFSEQNVFTCNSCNKFVRNFFSLKSRCLPTIWSKVALKFPRWCFIFIHPDDTYSDTMAIGVVVVVFGWCCCWCQ